MIAKRKRKTKRVQPDKASAELFKKRSKASKKGWKTKRRNLHPYKALVKEGLKVIKRGGSRDEILKLLTDEQEKIQAQDTVKSLGQARIAALGRAALLNGKATADWSVLKSFLSNEDPRYEYYIDLCEEAGFDVDEANDFWFSPEM